jgi:hypothetical protein
MDVEIIDDKVPFFDGGFRFDGALDVLEIVLLGAGRSSRDQADATGCDLEVDDKTQGAMADVLEFTPFDVAGA